MNNMKNTREYVCLLSGFNSALFLFCYSFNSWGRGGMKHIVLLKSRYFDLVFFYTLE